MDGVAGWLVAGQAVGGEGSGGLAGAEQIAGQGGAVDREGEGAADPGVVERRGGGVEEQVGGGEGGLLEKLPGVVALVILAAVVGRFVGDMEFAGLVGAGLDIGVFDRPENDGTFEKLMRISL
ncbi:MAG: hypothetical protein EA425_01570 [Puniceicoccaceae bacterium]|nr:MAG: hypothetical protein EA425_01570 [Puniceicoccaceae bacterium]